MIKRNTRQKRIILDALRSLDHPSATAVYEQVRLIDSKISRSTVFRVLSDEAEQGHLLRLHINGTDDRFDITLSEHAHIRCRVCGKVSDIMSASLSGLRAHIHDNCGYDIQSCEVVFYGTCPTCLAAKDKAPLPQG